MPAAFCSRARVSPCPSVLSKPVKPLEYLEPALCHPAIAGHPAAMKQKTRIAYPELALQKRAASATRPVIIIVIIIILYYYYYYLRPNVIIIIIVIVFYYYYCYYYYYYYCYYARASDLRRFNLIVASGSLNRMVTGSRVVLEGCLRRGARLNQNRSQRRVGPPEVQRHASSSALS